MKTQNHQETTVSFFKNFTEKVAEVPFSKVIEEIRGEKYASQISEIRRSLQLNHLSLADKQKKRLPAFTPSGVFTQTRNMEHFHQHSGIIHLDIDKVPDNRLNDIIQKVNSSPYTLASFKSPSGNGLKLFVKVQTTKTEHKVLYQLVQDFYENLTGHPADPKCKDLTRLCFVSSDPDAYWNGECDTLPGTLVYTKNADPLTEVGRFTEKVISFTEGNRNNFIHQFACNANRRGIGSNETVVYCVKHYKELDYAEIISSVKSAYMNNREDFGKFVNFVNTPDDKKDANDGRLSNSPLIPDSVYQLLPEILKKGTKVFKGRERDVFLTGAIGVLGGCMPGITGLYAHRIVYTNLFVFIVAPAASGKGALQSAKELADSYHFTLKNESDEMLRKFRSDHNIHLQSPGSVPPTQPKYRVLFIPGDVSSAKLLIHLDHNDGAGIVCETEADTLTFAFKKEWSTYSDIIRKVFHHEKISLSRKTNNEYLEINNARLSIVLSGTPNQATNLIKSPEDGLMSRFVFYTFNSNPEWKDVSPLTSALNLSDYFQSLGVEIRDMALFLEENPAMVELSGSQWKTLNSKFDEYLREAALLNTEDSLSIVKRLGLILFRICMILTTLRKFENKSISKIERCSETDFQIASELIDVYLQHGLMMLDKLPRNSSKSETLLQGSKKRFFDSLPPKFKRLEAIKVAETMGISESTIDKLLKNLAKWRYLDNSDYGWYVKIV